jgi:MFS family permease
VTGASRRAAGPIACFAALGIYWGAWAALIPDLKAQANATDGELGIAMLVSGAGAIAAMLVVGRLWRRVGWFLVPITGVAFGVAAFGPALATSPLTLVVALALVGATSGALDVAMNAAVSDVEANENARLMYGAHALFSLAVLVASFATGFAREAGTRPAAVLGVVMVAIVAVALVSVVSARDAGRRGRAAAAGRSLAAHAAALPSAILALAVLCAMGYLIEDAAQNWSALHMERNLGATPALGGAAPGVFAGTMFLGRSLGQRLGRRFTDRQMLSGGAALAAAGLIALAAAPAPEVALGGLALAGAGIAVVAPALYGRAGRSVADAQRGAAIARLTVFGYTGFVVGPALIGFLAEAFDLRVGLATLAGLAIALSIAGALVLRGREPAAIAEGEELLKTGRA